MKNVISIRDLGKEGVERVLIEAERMVPYAHEGKIFPLRLRRGYVVPKVTILALERSHRTCGSFHEATRLLGLYPIRLNEEDTSIPKNESYARTLRMLLIQGASILVVRTKYEGGPKYAIEVVAKHGFHAPIINAGDGKNRHPSQALLDALTMKQRFGKLKGLTIALCGDVANSRVAHDLLEICKMFDVRVGFYSSQEIRIPQHWMRGLDIVFMGDALNELRKCNILYALRPQFERMSPLELKLWLSADQITPAFLDAHCHPKVLVFHAQPIDKAQDPIKLFPGLDDDKRFSTIDLAASNGIPVRMALLAQAYARISSDEPLPQPKFSLTSKPPQRISDRLKRKQYKIFRPIDSGTVIDHLPQGRGDIIVFLICAFASSDRPAILAQRIESRGMGRKDVIVLEGVHLPPQVKASIALLAPLATFNELDGQKIRKTRVDPGLKHIPAAFSCPGPDCISNNDPECQPKFSAHELDGKRIIACSWCEREFELEEIWRNIRVRL